MSANTETVPDLISYMSQKLLKVAELNTILDSLERSTKLLPTVGNSIRFKTYAPNSDWMRIRRAVDDFDLGGFDFAHDNSPTLPLETRALTAEDREALESLELF